MDAPVERLGRVVQGLREALARGYLAELLGSERPPGPRLDERLLEAVANGRDALSPDEYAAFCAHLARAELERALRPTRAARAALARETVPLDGQDRALGHVLVEWLTSRDVRVRKRLLGAAEPVLEAHDEAQRDGLARAEHAARTLIERLAPSRHPDAGPEDGSRALAEEWLSLSADVAEEAFASARKIHASQADDGDDTLWSVLAPRYGALFPRDERFRRCGAELAALGLHAGLRRSARVAPAHHDVLLGTQLLQLAVPGDLRLSPSAFEVGLAAEWRAAESVGRAGALAFAARGVFPGLRHPSAGTVARAIGAVTSLRFIDPEFLRKQRGLSRREAEDTARCAVAHTLAESRILAAAVLARGRSTGDTHALMERALVGSLGPALANLLARRASASASLRGKAYAPALFVALRERFDSDWTRNPRAADALCGAAARAGALSVESWAAELSATIPRAVGLYSELF